MPPRVLTSALLALATAGAGAEGEPVRQLPGNQPCSFPPTAQQQAITGPVRFLAQVTPEGGVASVEIQRAPWPGLGFEDAVRECVMQWRFEPSVTAEAGLRSYPGQVRFRVAPAEEAKIRQLLEQLAAAWNARDQDAIEDLEVKDGEVGVLSSPREHFLRKTVQGEERSDRWRLELEPDVTSLRFLRGDLAEVRQPYARVNTEGTPQDASRAAVLELTAARTARGWRFVGLAPSERGWFTASRVGSGTIKEPRKLKDVKPSYPQKAKEARVQGIVILECVISPEGKVTSIRILRGIPLLDEAAIRAVRQWIYTPTLLNGTPVPVIMTVTVNFRLS